MPPVWGAWGKWSRKRLPHPLVCHLIDTALVARELLPRLLGPRCLVMLRTTFRPLGDADGWIAVLCGIHDLGKYSPTFQGIKADLAAGRLGPEAASDVHFVRKLDGVQRLDIPHGLLTALHVKDMLTSWGADVVVADGIAVVLGGHHGYFPKSSAVAQARTARNDHGGETWARWRDAMVLQIVDHLGLVDPRTLPWSKVEFDVVAGVGLAGLTTVSDWIASDESNYESPDGPFDLAEYVRAARPRAVHAVLKAGVQPWKPPVDTSFRGLNPKTSDVPEVRPVQVLAERLVADRRGPTMVVVEAPTGEGKTLLALQAAATLVRTLKLSGVYVGMPTKATSNQVLEEFEALLDRIKDTTGVHLVHSDARNYLAERDTEPSDIGHDDPHDDDTAAREWFTRKKSLLASLGVGTVDQVVRAGIRSGHGFVRLAGLSGKVVVFDEVHAYGVHMSTLLDRLLMWLGRLGVSVVVLSATLPTRRRDELVRAWQAGVTGRRPGSVAAVPACGGYPRVTVADEEGVTAHKAGVSKVNRERDVVLDHPVPAERVVSWLLEQARSGRGVTAVHNTVSRAKKTYEEVNATVARLPQEHFVDGVRPVVKLIHGQMDRVERSEVERWLRRGFGPTGTRVPAIVVGTQVLEQSLDLDFDAMLTDLAPMDLLIQRAGRVHRHNRTRRGPLLLGITGVTDTDNAPVFPPHVHTIYARYVLLRTWALLRHRTVIHCPQEVPALVDAVYGPPEAVPCPSGWQTAWRQAETAHRTHVHRQVDRAANLYLPVPVGEVVLEQLSEQPQDPRRTRENKGNR
ncbi:CRISPR-associated helicase Cas3' [Saccharothrix yanglingensis]|uniref:CRISPR-associated helicase Cas3' n=1 Tax=Saccharothrix yanglingensis TaxID=659496 RepID=UPI0027D34A6D|nr:CRISPR-associated helicase Cas3' [Saccharothrix yanglingensis]